MYFDYAFQVNTVVEPCSTGTHPSNKGITNIKKMLVQFIVCSVRSCLCLYILTMCACNNNNKVARQKAVHDSKVDSRLVTLPLTEETDKESGDSEGSDSEDDFVVVIPDCFNLDIPLSSHSAPHSVTHSRGDFDLTGTSPGPAPTTATAADDVMTRSSDSTPSQPPVPHVDPGQQTPPTAAVPKTTGASPQTERRRFVPSRVTLREVKDARIRNPLTMATGLVNTVTDLVEGLTLTGKKREGRRGEEGGQQHCHPPPVPDEEEEERFVVSGSFYVGSCRELHV